MRALQTWVLAGLAWSVIARPLCAAVPEPVLTVDIVARPLSEALAAFSRQTGLQLIYVSAIAETQRSPGARSGLAAPEALRELLAGTGLRFEFLNERTVRIFPAPVVVPTLAASANPVRSSEHHIEGGPGALEEVVVIGTRGAVPLSQAPLDLVVWSAEAMEVSGVKGLPELAALTPGIGFAFSPGIGSDFYTHLQIRGVTNRHGATVGLYLDDVPIPLARQASYLRSLPVTFDVDQVEVLRGPQTVLLGEHTQGGAIRFNLTQPSLTQFSAQTRLEWDSTQYGGMSYEAGAAAGGPVVSDRVGLRLSGWYREQGGYVDRVDPQSPTLARVDTDANRYVSKLARGALVFALTDALQLSPSVTYQSLYIHDTSTFDTTVSSPARGLFLNTTAGRQPFEDSYILASLHIAGHLRAADLSGFVSCFDRNATAVFLVDEYGLSQRVYEADLRLTSSDSGAALSWLGGLSASFQHARNPSWPAMLPASANDLDESEWAAYGQLTLRFAASLTGDVGVRAGHWKYSFWNEVPPASLEGDSSVWAAPAFGLAWQAQPQTLIYARAARGYGSGGVAPNLGSPGYSEEFPADALWSFEVGAKQVLWNERLHLTVGAFHITWRNGIPNPQYVNLQEHIPVPGTAVSNGFDLGADAWLGHTRAALSAAYSDAHVTQTVRFDEYYLFAARGNSLQVSPWNVTAWIEHDIPIDTNRGVALRIEDVFRSSSGATFLNNLQSIYQVGIGGNPAIDPSTNVLNLRAALHGQHFEIAALLTNALNAHPSLTGSANGVDQATITDEVYTLVPRTLHLSGNWRF